MINETVIELAKASSYSPSLITIWVSTILIFIIFTALIKSENVRWGNFWKVTIMTSVASGIILWFLVSSPEGTNEFFNELKTFFRI